MKKQYYVALIGIDFGGPEDGPIIKCSKEYIKAKTEEKADKRIKHIIERDYQNEIEGYSVHLASTEEIDELYEMVRECPPLPF